MSGLGDDLSDALLRAKELSATPGNGQSTTLKRSNAEDDSYPAKRATMDGMHGASIITTLGGHGGGMGGMAGYGAGAQAQMSVNPNENVVEVIVVPDNSVGLVIGKGGSEISLIQSQSGARVQMAPESGGDGTRQCTLQGTRLSVDRARQLISDVIMRAAARRAGGGGGASGPFNGDHAGGPNSITFDMLIPGSKCGLVIGKAGETIRQLQEQAGIKMMMIQDNTESGGAPKPLRMTGDPDKIEFAKRLVQDLLNSRGDDGGMGGGGGGGGMGGMGMGGGGHMGGGQAKGEVVVPRSSVGMIIGKGGDTIKRLAMETGTKIQFKPDDPSLPDRCAVITGTREQIYKATELITELVQKSCSQNGGMGGGGMGGGPQVQDTFYMHVPANKTGLVIGKGGETIKQICSESLAHVELSREPPPNGSEKVFIIKGTAYQIHHAQHVIRIKVGDIAPGTPVPPMAGGGGAPMGMGMGFNGGAGGFPMGGGQWNNSFGGPDQGNGWGGGMPQQQFYGAPQAAPQTFAMQQPSYAAAGGVQQFAAQPAVAAAPAAGAPAAAAPAAGAAGGVGVNPATGQADYSAQWAEYYRSMGMHDQAAKIEAQMGRGGAAGAPASAAAAAAPQGQVQYANAGQFQQPQAF